MYKLIKTRDIENVYDICDVELTIADDADLDELLDCFKSFLTASGFVIRGDLQVVSDEVELEADEDSEDWTDVESLVDSETETAKYDYVPTGEFESEIKTAESMCLLSDHQLMRNRMFKRSKIG